MVNWKKIREEWETSQLTLKALAEKYNVKLGTLKSRKSREKWSRDGPKKELPAKQLTDKQKLFCTYYVKNFNATQAAIKAGYAADSAHVTGNKLLKHPNVSKEMKRMKQKVTNELTVSAIDVLDKYIKIAFADITDYMNFHQKEVQAMDEFGPLKDKDGKPVTKLVQYVDMKEPSAVDGTIITEIKQNKYGVSIKLADKMKALEKLSLYFDLFPDAFKRKIEAEKLKIAHHKLMGSDEKADYEDDGFLHALDGKTEEVWSGSDE